MNNPNTGNASTRSEVISIGAAVFNVLQLQVEDTVRVQSTG